MNDITVKNLDLGYSQCEAINNTSLNAGETLLNNLSSNIANLKSHWVGTDATAHINNLINVYKGLGALINDALIVTHDAAESMISVQRVRNANGGEGMIGESLRSSMEFMAVSPAEPTVEYYVDPSALNDLTTLQDIFKEYQNFLNTFTTEKDDLLGNWLAGANREKVVSIFDEFYNNTEMYTNYFNSAIENLTIATKNISRL